MTSSVNTVKQAALKIVQKLPGSRVHPCPPLTKKLTAKDWPLHATNDPEVIDFLFNDPQSNIALMPGTQIAIFDIEGPDKGRFDTSTGAPLDSGEESLAKLIAKLGPLPPTLTGQTPSRGKHLYFLIPHAMATQTRALGYPNVEFRTGGRHYCLTAPSRTDTGEYRWIDPHAHVAELPPQWVEAFDVYQKPSLTRDRAPGTGGLGEVMKGQREARLSKNRKVPQLEPILAGCPWISEMVNNQKSQSEVEWYNMLSIVGRCEDGEKLAHLCSKDYPGYSHGDTAAKLERALHDTGPATCSHIKSKHCEGCTFAYHGEGWSPLALGLHHPGMVKVLSNVVYADLDGVFMPLAGRARVSKTLYSHSVQKVLKTKPLDQLLSSAALVHVRKLDYLAGEDSLVVGDTGNTWVRDGVEPKEGDWSTIGRFVDYLLPVRTEREHILDYLAHLIQKPSVKVAARQSA